MKSITESPPSSTPESRGASSERRSRRSHNRGNTVGTQALVVFVGLTIALTVGIFAGTLESVLDSQGVDPLLAEAARIRLGQDLAKAETEPALREFVAATWSGGAGAPAQTVFKTLIGEPANAILEAATADSADLIVMGTQGLGGFKKWLLGSTTERLLRRTHVPVLAVPLVSASQMPYFTMQALRFHTFWPKPTSASLRSLQRGLPRISRCELSASLTLVHVVEPLTVPHQWQALLEESDQNRLGTARTNLKALTAQVCGTPGCDDIVVLGRPAELIGSIARDRGMQLIVMGLASDRGVFAPRPGTDSPIAYCVRPRLLDRWCPLSDGRPVGNPVGMYSCPVLQSVGARTR